MHNHKNTVVSCCSRRRAQLLELSSVDDVHATGNTTTGLSESVSSSGDAVSTASSLSNSAPPWPANSLMVRVLGGNGTLAITIRLRSPTVAPGDTGSPGCNRTPLPNASTATLSSGTASAPACCCSCAVFSIRTSLVAAPPVVVAACRFGRDVAVRVVGTSTAPAGATLPRSPVFTGPL